MPRLRSPRRLPPAQAAHFTRQLATLVRAGLPVVRALHLIARQERRGRIHDLCLEIARGIEAGGTLSEGMQRRPDCFDTVYVSLVRAGEAAGILAEILDRLAVFLEKSNRLEARLRTAMLYPAVVGASAVSIVIALVVFVVPRFQEIFATLLKGTPLPALTRAILALCDAFTDHWILLVIVSVLAGIAASVARRAPAVALRTDRLVLKFPVFGPLRMKVAVARFSRTCGALLAGGVPILRAITIGGGTFGNLFLAGAMDRVRERIEAGDTFAGPLEATGAFPPLMVGMIAVGEETGAVPEMLDRIAEDYEEAVDVAVAGLASLLEPLMVVAMALVVGTIVLALFLPIVGIIQAMG